MASLYLKVFYAKWPAVLLEQEVNVLLTSFRSSMAFWMVQTMPKTLKLKEHYALNKTLKDLWITSNNQISSRKKQLWSTLRKIHNGISVLLLRTQMMCLLWLRGWKSKAVKNPLLRARNKKINRWSKFRTPSNNNNKINWIDNNLLMKFTHSCFMLISVYLLI